MAASDPAQPLATRAPHLSTALDAFFDWYYRTYPVSATFIGIHDNDHRLPDLSADGVAGAVDGLESLRSRLKTLPEEQMTAAERLDRALAEGILDIQAWEFASGHFHAGNPSLYTGEAIFGVIGLLLRPFAPVGVRLRAAAERMGEIPRFLAQGRSNVRRAPAAWTQRAIRECDGALALLERGIDLYLQDEGTRDAGTPLEAAALRTAARSAAAAFRDFRSYLSGELSAQPGDAYACGPAALDLLLRRGHYLDGDAESVLTLGRERMVAAKEQLREQASALGSSDWREALRRLSGVHPSAESYYSRYGDLWREARTAAEARGLVSWPDYPIRYLPQPRWAREAAPSLYFLFYRAPAAFDHLPIVDYLVTPVEPNMPADEQQRRLRATNESVIKLNHVIHHGGLGHHVQNWFAYHRASSRIARIAAVDCAARIALFCGGTMAEGWACYATDLMEEIGFLTPLERLSQAHGRLRMAARAVADVRLHTGVWSLGETAAFYQDAAALSAEAAGSEAVKNSMFPGTALMYLCGTETLHRLRRTLEGRPGFTLRAFHDRLLSMGSAPGALAAVELSGKKVL